MADFLQLIILLIMIFIHSFRFITMKLVIIATFPEQFLQVRISKKETKI